MWLQCGGRSLPANRNIHLFNSEKEAKEKGMDLGEMDAKLLKMIEEQTLYMIDLKKENNDQYRQIQLLQYEVGKLKDQNKISSIK